jgi:hypothetical protein
MKPRYRVRKSGSRFYPWVVFDIKTKRVKISGFDVKAEAQREADRLNESEGN